MKLPHEALYRNFFDNPILTRELRRRMRGKALIFSIMGYIALMTVTSIMILVTRVGGASLFEADETAELLKQLSAAGQSLFYWITFIQALLVIIIAPTITAGMTTGEKERKTFEFLQVTTISPWMYIIGCFLSTVFYVGLALLCALPLISLTFLYGGVGRGDVLRATVYLMGASMVLSAFGLFVSSVRERTRTAQGIVVFVIFALIFGGSIALQQLTTWLGTASATAGGAAPGAGMSMPPLMLEIGVILYLTILFLLMAVRKLFDPAETRAFGYTQFLVLAAVPIVGMLSWASGLPMSNGMLIAFLSLGAVLLGVGAWVFAAGRMEVGDEMWHLKRALPLLRPLDQSLPYLLLLGVLWWWACRSFMGSSPLGTTPAGLIPNVMLVTLATYGLFVAVARFVTAFSTTSIAVMATASVMGGLWVVLPLLGGLVLGLGQMQIDDSPISMVLGFLMRFSPFAVIFEAIGRPEAFPAQPNILMWLTLPNAVLAGLLAMVLLLVGEWRRWVRWRHFDYHYDMPLS